MGWGGRRPGAGAKPKSKRARALSGVPAHRNVVAHPSVPVSPPSTNSDQAPAVDEFAAPDSLNAEERAVWLRQAPFAFKNGTLTRATAMSFERYCRMVVLERSFSTADSDHRGLLQRINAVELQFLLTPCGKAMAEPEQPAKPANPLERFLNRRREA